MRVAAGVEMLEIAATLLGRADVIYPTIFRDEERAVLVDAGFPGQLPLFREAMAQAGIPLGKLTAIVITHQDIDHIGSLPDMVKEAPQHVEVFASAVEKPFIQGDQRLLKITPEAVARVASSLPPELAEQARTAFQRLLEHPPKASVDKTVADGEVLPYCGGIAVIDTPGHTPGHICLYHQQSKTLIAGDALRVADGQLLGPSPQATLDIPLAMQSLKKLTQYDLERVICYHGGLYASGANERLAELASEG